VSLGLHLLHAAHAVTGGTAGLSLLLGYATAWPFWLLFLVINAPFALLAVWRRGWTSRSALVCIGAVSGWALVHDALFPVAWIEPWYGTLAGNLLAGVGVLILFRHRASVGGINIIGLEIQDRTGFRAGWTMMIFDVLIVLSALLVVPWTNVLMSAVAPYCSTSCSPSTTAPGGTWALSGACATSDRRGTRTRSARSSRWRRGRGWMSVPHWRHGLPLAAVHPVLLAGARVARERGGGRSRFARIMRAAVSMRAGDVRTVQVVRGACRQDAADEQQLVGVLVPEPGEVALVEDRDVDGTVSAEARAAASGSQSGPSRSGPRWPTRSSSLDVGTRSTIAISNPTAVARRADDRARLERGRPPPLARAEDQPAPLHLEVRVQRHLDAHEECACRGRHLGRPRR
jgi:hypothetical protein